MTVEEIKRLLGLVPLEPEGGFFAETYRSTDVFAAGSAGAGRRDERSLSTAIYYLLDGGSFSALHRLRADELFHFYLGDPVEMLHLHPDGTGRLHVLGPDLGAGMRPQVVVPRGVWQGTRLLAGGRFALLGTTVAPGFDSADFETGRRDELISAYPAFRERIVALTR